VIVKAHTHDDLVAGAKERACKWCGGGMDGKRSNAVFCSTKCADASYHNQHPRRRSEYKRKYQEANREKHSENKRKDRQANPEKYAEYRQANPEKFAEYQREYREANREKRSEYQRKYREANREKIAEKDCERYNSQSAAASTLSLAYTISQIEGALTNGPHEPE